MDIKILSWNIWIESKFDDVKEFIRSNNADIVGLQEVRNDDPERPIIPFMVSLGYDHVFTPVAKIWGGKTWNDGPAVFSKFPIKSAVKYILGTEDHRGAARADIEINNQILHVFSTHLTHTHQKDTEVQIQQVEDLMSEILNKKTVLMGDFNAIPESSAIKKVAEKLKDTDSGNQPTWSVYPEGCNVCNPQEIDIRLDYIFASPDLSTSNYHVNHSKGSDHLPISVTLHL